MKTAIITGGSGFVGRHLIRYLLEQGTYERVVNIDIQPPGEGFYGLERVEFIQHDLRKPVGSDVADTLSGDQAVIYNLAAICRIPGFPDRDYFETNIRGAEHTVALAEAIGCRNIVFTSSVAPYGASEELKTEESVPMPDNPYGSSKLSAEYIHRLWQQGDPEQRKLTILRPGIIFGRNEQANFTRLYNSLKKGYFFYPGRKDTRKACVYVKDVARACLHFARNGDSPFQLYNLVYEQAPPIEEICTALTRHTDAKKARFTMPAPLLMSAARTIQLAGTLTRRDVAGIHPDRVKKVMISTNVSGEKLGASEFDLEYSLEDAIIDWFEECDGTLR